MKSLIQKNEEGIWRWNSLLSEIPSIKLSLGEGLTRLEKFNFGEKEFFVKREDENFGGSYKIRGMAYQISKEIDLKFGNLTNSTNETLTAKDSHLQGNHEKEKNLNFTISTSGNAGVASSLILKKFNDEFAKNLRDNSEQHPIAKLFVFVPKKIEKWKLEKIKENPDCEIIFSDEPKKESLMLDKQGKAKSIRQSTSPFATEGFKTLGFEVFLDFPKVENIFFPTSSGTSLLGCFYGFKTLQERGFLKKIPNFFAVQTTKVFPIAKEFDPNLKPEKDHPASAISDFICHRKSEILNQIKDGESKRLFSMAISASENFEADKILKEKFSLNVSFESALTFAAFKRMNFPKNSVLISSGK